MISTLSVSDKKLKYLLFFIIYATDAAIVNTNSDRIWARIAWIGILILTFIYVPKAHYTSKDKTYLGTFSLAILASMFVTEGFDVNFIQRIVLLWFSLAIVSIVDYDRLMNTYIKIMRFIALFSMICFMLAPILTALPLPRMQTGDVSYVSLFFTNISTHNDRNYGPFWEPGAFQLYLNWAIFYELRNMKRFKLSDIVIFVLCILTTKSTGGIVILAMMFIYYLLFAKHDIRDRKSKRLLFWVKIFIILLSIAGISAFILVPELYDTVFGKLVALKENSTEINSANVSSMTRLLSMPASISAFRMKPLFGWGIDGLKGIIMLQYGITSNTNSILGMAALFGIIPGILYLGLFIKLVCMQNRDFLGRIWLFMILCAMFCTENLVCSLFFWCILFYESRRKVRSNESYV